jgi:Na+/citrate or Na+/malate symporter
VFTDTVLFWVLPLISGASGSVIVMLPIAYFQDLTPGRPGSASALLALQKLTVDILTAVIFAAGFALAGFEGVALIGAALGLAGGLGLYLADRNDWFAAKVAA